MNRCKQYRKDIQYYLDGELLLPEVQQLEKHFLLCSDCKAYCEEQRRFLSLLRAARPLCTASAQLRSQVEEAFAQAESEVSVPTSLKRRIERQLGLRRTYGPAYKLVTSILLATLIGLSWFWGRTGNEKISPASSFEALAVDAHRHRLSDRLPLDIVTTSPSEVNEWFGKRLNFRFELPVSAGYSLQGGRLVNLGRSYAACIAYTGEQPVTLLIASAGEVELAAGSRVDRGRLSFYQTAVDGLRVITWVDNGLAYALVSDTERQWRSCAVCHKDLSEIMPFTP